MKPQLEFDTNIKNHWGIIISKSFELMYKESSSECDFNWSRLNLESLIVHVNELNQQIKCHLLESYPSPKDQLLQRSNFHNLIFFNLLWEQNLITPSIAYYCEPYLGVFCNIKFGSLFYLKFIEITQLYELSIQSILSHSDPSDLIQVVNYFQSEIESLQEWNICFSSLIITPILVSSILNPLSSHLDQELDKLADSYLTKVLNKSTEPINSLKTCLVIYKIFLENFVTLCIFNLSTKLNLIDEVDFETFTLQDLTLPLVDLEFPKVNFSKCFSIFEKLTSSLLDWYSKVGEEKNLSILFQSDPIVEQCLNSILDIIQVWPSLMEQAINYESIDLLPKKLKNILNDYSKLIDSINDDTLKPNQFILQFIDSKKPGFKFLFFAIIKYSDEHIIERVIKSVEPYGLLDPRIVSTLCSKIASSSSSSFSNNLFTFLKLLTRNISSVFIAHHYIKLHIGQFDLSRIGVVNEIELRNLLNRVCHAKEIITPVVSEILANFFLDPLAILNCILLESIANSHGFVTFAVKLSCIIFSPLCSYPIDASFKKTLFIAMIIDKLRNCNESHQLKGIIELVRKVFFHYFLGIDRLNKIDQPRILTLESLLLALIDGEGYDQSQTISSSLMIIKLIVSLSPKEKKPWIDISKEPVPFLWHLLQFIDQYKWDGEKKEIIISLLQHIMAEKLNRKLTLAETMWLGEMLKKNLIHLTYLEPILTHPLDQIFDLDEITPEQILILASVCSNSKWMVDKSIKISVNKIEHELTTVIKFLTKQEWLNLFFFLQNYYSKSCIIHLFCESILDKSYNIDKVNHSYIIACLLNVIKTVIFSKNEDDLLNPIGDQDAQEFVIKEDMFWSIHHTMDSFERETSEYIAIFKSLSLILYSNQHEPEDKENLRSILIDLGKLLRRRIQRDIIIKTFFESDSKLHPLAKEILQTILNIENLENIKASREIEFFKPDVFL